MCTRISQEGVMRVSVSSSAKPQGAERGLRAASKTTLQRKSRHLGALEACVQGGSKLGKGCHNSQDYIRTAGLQSAGNLSVIRVALRKLYV